MKLLHFSENVLPNMMNSLSLLRLDARIGPHKGQNSGQEIRQFIRMVRGELFISIDLPKLSQIEAFVRSRRLLPIDLQKREDELYYHSCYSQMPGMS